MTCQLKQLLYGIKMTNLNRLKFLAIKVFDIAFYLVIFTAVAWIFFGCSEPKPESKETATTEFPADPKPDAADEPVANDELNVATPDTQPLIIKLSLLTENGTLYFYDGSDFIYQNNTDTVNCGPKCFTDGNTSNTYNIQGEIQSTTELIIAPDFIIDNIIIENIPPSVAADMGAQAKNYVQIYIDGVALAGDLAWYWNKYTATDFIKTDSGTYVIIDSVGGYHSLDGTTGINHAKNLLIHDSAVNTARINGHPVTWSRGYFGNAKHWQFTDNRWISNNGYEYLEGVLAENTNAMWVWNVGPYPVALPGVERPVVISASGGYWIEANTGWLFKHTDHIELISRIYLGDGYRTSGMQTSKELAPVIIGQDLFYNYDGSVWKLDISTGIIEIFYAGRAQIREW